LFINVCCRKYSKIKDKSEDLQKKGKKNPFAALQQMLEQDEQN